MVAASLQHDRDRQTRFGIHKLRGQLRQRFKDKSPLFVSGMWDCESLCVDLLQPKIKDINVYFRGAPFCGVNPPGIPFDSLEPPMKIRRRHGRVDFNDGIQEIRLFLDAERFCLVDARGPDNVRSLKRIDLPACRTEGCQTIPEIRAKAKECAGHYFLDRVISTSTVSMTPLTGAPGFRTRTLMLWTCLNLPRIPSMIACPSDSSRKCFRSMTELLMQSYTRS